jgi:16S rRNA (guanine966-N2)-methyltransferase
VDRDVDRSDCGLWTVDRFMRIIAGEFKGRRLKAPKWNGLRPTSDKLRETLFNILAPRVAGARVLDVFAGTGAVGLESLSRGAELAVFIDSDPRAAALIRENAALCGATDRCVIIRDTAELVLATRIAEDLFDIVVLDPPYDYEPLAEVIDRGARHLAPGGVLVLEHASRRPLPEVAGPRGVRTVRSGDSALTMFEVA